MNWKTKAAIQGVLSAVPGGEWMNDRLQRRGGGLKNFEANVDEKVAGDWRQIAGYLREAGIEMRGKEILEVGTGWHPALPLAFTLGGAARVRTFDIRRHMAADLAFRMAAHLERHLPLIAEAGGRPLEEVRADHAKLMTAGALGELLAAARIEYVAPGDAAATGLKPTSVDLVYSNSVLEHIPAPVIGRIFEESRRVLRPGGAMVHAIACHDHYAHGDRSITALNYLRYPETEWRRWNNALHYQNRLRAPDFLKLAGEAGFRVVVEHRHVREPERIRREMSFAAEFSRYEWDDLVATSLDFVARPA